MGRRKDKDLNERDRQSVKDSIETAVLSARATGKRYFLLCPYIANRNMKGDLCWLGMPLINEDVLEPDDAKQVAFTVFPNGCIQAGLAQKWRAQELHPRP